MGYIDPNQPDHEIFDGDKRQIEKDKQKANGFDRTVLFSQGSTYNGNPQALARLAARAGKTLPLPIGEPGVKPGSDEDPI